MLLTSIEITSTAVCVLPSPLPTTSEEEAKKKAPPQICWVLPNLLPLLSPGFIYLGVGEPKSVDDCVSAVLRIRFDLLNCQGLSGDISLCFAGALSAESQSCYLKIHLCRKWLGAVDTRRYPRAENGSGATRKPTRREDRAASSCGDPTVTRSTIRANVGVAIVPQTISRHLAEANLKSKRPFRALPLTPEHRQLRLQWCQARSMWNVTDWQKVVFSDESRFVWETDDNRVRVWRRPDSSMACPLPRFVPCRTRVGSAKTADAIVHSVHDLELVVQDLCAYLPQDNIRCLINSMPDRVAACIAAGGGPTRY
ncbi:transposable element Tcb2 transposase [Trichonephila clavipes]|uniref:Transposable element Tcb2 transposase n=1 Tax=Trichonephila clavipes TaxID=2585209 RepID=A0A8X6V2C6_TRICX|nr:transposable element Tcb2 transposase [Trichonephila clavipes]